MTRPIAPSGEFKIKDIVYSGNGVYTPMSDNEFLQGRNNCGEGETPLGSEPDAQKENYLFRYLTEQINYLTKMVEYLETKVGP